MAKITFDLTGQSNISANSAIQGAAYSVNCYTEFNTDKNAYLLSAPGLKYANSPSTDYGTCTGMCSTSTNKLFVAYSSGAVYYLDEEHRALTKVLSISADSTPIFAETGGQRPHLLIADGYTLYSIDLSTMERDVVTLPKRVDGEDYVQPTSVVVVDGTVVITDKESDILYFTIKNPLDTEERTVFQVEDGKVVYEDDGITVKEKTVSSAEYMFLDDYGTQLWFTASSSSDTVLAISSINDKLTILGASSIEYRQKQINELDTTTTISWQLVTHTEQKSYGIYAPHSLASIDKKQFLIGTGDATDKCVLMLSEGTNVTRISLPWLDAILSKYATTETIGWTYSTRGHSFYVIALPDFALVYDTGTQQWHIRLSRNYDYQKTKYLAQYCAFYDGKLYVGSALNSCILTLEPEYYYEDLDSTTSIPLLRIRQSPVFNSNFSPFLIKSMTVELNTGYAKDYSAPSKILLSLSQDGGYTYSNSIEASTGRLGEYSARATWLNLGMSRLTVLRLAYSEPTPFTLTYANIDYQQLSGVL